MWVIISILATSSKTYYVISQTWIWSDVIGHPYPRLIRGNFNTKHFNLKSEDQDVILLVWGILLWRYDDLGLLIPTMGFLTWWDDIFILKWSRSPLCGCRYPKSTNPGLGNLANHNFIFKCPPGQNGIKNYRQNLWVEFCQRKLVSIYFT